MRFFINLWRRKIGLASFALYFCLGAAQAGPMGFKGSVMSMGDFHANWQEVWVNYATTPRDAWGVGTVWMRSDDQQRTRQALELNYTRLAKRWNMPHAQANLWLLGGVGALQGTGLNGNLTLLTPGVQLDYETTRIYLAGNVRLYRAGDLSGTGANSVIHDYASVRAGFSFYEVSYEETQPWLVLEARTMRGLSEQTEVTPMLRLINKRYFIELGINNMNQTRFNFMYIF